MKWLWLAAGAALGAAWLARWTRDALSESQHVWRDECLTSLDTHAHLLYMLDRFHVAMAAREVTWWIDYGTLLGAWRTGRLLPWDHDLDISYLASDREALESAAEELAAAGITLNLDHYGMFYRGTKLDLEPWIRRGDKLVRVEPNSRDWLRNLHDAAFDDFPASWIEPLWAIELEHRVVPCPQEPGRLLRRRYPTHRVHPRLSFPHKQRCWVCVGFWQGAWRIFRSTYEPVVLRP